MSTPGHLGRRAFLRSVASAAVGVPVILRAAASRAQAALTETPAQKRVPTRVDVAIIGGGLGGCAAAMALARSGFKVLMTEETDWIGGQLTSQAVPPDENPWIESFGGTASYLELRRCIREYYLRNFPVTAAARATRRLNPGNGNVSLLCHEPRASLAALHELLASHIHSGRLTILLETVLVAAAVERDKITSVVIRNLRSGKEHQINAQYFLDATELGDLLPLARAEYVTGAESQKDTGEPHASAEAAPKNQQSFTCCFAMDYLPGEDHTIVRPAEYAFWHDHVPALTPAWPGKLLAWEYSDPISLKPKKIETDPAISGGFWLYRRIIDKSQFLEGTYASDITLVNWPQNDYMLGYLCDVPAEEAAQNVNHAKQLSLSWLYWLQTEAPRPDGGTGWKGIRLRPDVVGTEDGLAKYPYIRESRRIKAEFTVVEQHVSTEYRMQETKTSREEVKATEYPDSAGIGSYRIDLHPTTGGNNYLDISSLPFQIPLGALVPVRLDNLLPACKNLGVTHITNGCFRLHPVEWNIGESAGMLAAFCLKNAKAPREIRTKRPLLAEFQRTLTDQGIPLSWPHVTPR